MQYVGVCMKKRDVIRNVVLVIVKPLTFSNPYLCGHCSCKPRRVVSLHCIGFVINLREATVGGVFNGLVVCGWVSFGLE